MPQLIDCLTLAEKENILDSKVKDRLLGKQAKLIEGGMDERKAGQQVINEYAHEYGEKLHKELNGLRKAAGLQSNEFAPFKTKGNVEEITQRHEQEINAITNKQTDNAIPIEKSNEVDVRQQAADGEGVGEGNEQRREPAGTQEEDKGTGEEEAPMTGIQHASTEEGRKEMGLPDYERKVNPTDAELREQAKEEISKGYNVEKLIKNIENKIAPSGLENKILEQYLAGLEADFRKTHSEETQAKAQRVYNAIDVIGTLQSEAFRTRKGLVPSDDTMLGFFVHEIEANNDAPLTEKQKELATNQYEKFQQDKAKFDEDRNKFEEEVTKFRAEQELAKTKKTTQKNTKKTHEDFVSERDKIFTDIKDKLRKARGQASATIVPYANELIAIAPDVAKLMKSLVEEGVNKLEDVVKNIHGQLKEHIPQIQEKDVHDIIAGNYNGKKQTRTEVAIAMQNLKLQAQAINKFEAAINNEPANEKAKVKKNQVVTEFKKQLGIDKLEQLQTLKKRNETESARIKEKIDKGDFAPEEKKTPLLEDKELQKKFPELYKSVVTSRDELIKTKREIEIRRARMQFENRTPQQKFATGAIQVINAPRTAMASMDYSAPLRQGIIASTAHPALAAKATKFMFQASKNEKLYNRWIDDVHNSPRWDIAEKTKLAITDPNTLHLKEKEEAYLGGNIVEKIPFLGTHLVKGSERAYIGFLNKMRWDLFNQYADAFEAKGKTYENSPELYKGIASYVNSSTGRGGMSFGEAAAPLMSSVLFSPRLIASRMNMLGLTDIPNLVVRASTLGKRGVDYGFYTKLPKELRIEAAKDMIKFVSVGLATLALAKYGFGADVEGDPRSTDFGKIKSGNTRWDIWGGFQPYARLLAQLMSGETKSSNTGKIYELNGKGAYGKDRGDVLETFGRGKLAPVPSFAWDVIKGRTVIGEKVNRTFDVPFYEADNPETGITITDEVLQHTIPLLLQDVREARKDRGISALFTAGVPSLFGVGVNTYQPKETKSAGSRTMAHGASHGGMAHK